MVSQCHRIGGSPVRFKKGDLVLHSGQNSWMQPVQDLNHHCRRFGFDNLYGIVLGVQGNKNGTVEVYWVNGKFYNHYAGALKLIARGNHE